MSCAATSVAGAGSATKWTAALGPRWGPWCAASERLGLNARTQWQRRQWFGWAAVTGDAALS